MLLFLRSCVYRVWQFFEIYYFYVIFYKFFFCRYGGFIVIFMDLECLFYFRGSFLFFFMNFWFFYLRQCIRLKQLVIFFVVFQLQFLDFFIFVWFLFFIVDFLFLIYLQRFCFFDLIQIDRERMEINYLVIMRVY